MALRVMSGSYDITDEIESLAWSSVNPGGDETCTFTFKRSWFASSPEIARGNLLRVLDGIDELFRGRVEETDRSGESTEEISVTAYGLGVRLKDTTMQEIYVTRDLSHWVSPTAQRIINLIGLGYKPDAFSPSTAGQDAGGEGPGIVVTAQSFDEAGKEIGEMWFYGGGVDLGEIIANFHGHGEDANWLDIISLATDDVATTTKDSADQNAKVESLNLAVVAPGAGYKYAKVDTGYEAAFVGTANIVHRWTSIRIFGRHGLTKQGAQPNEGFLVSQMVADAAARASGITIRRVDATSFVLQEAAFFDWVDIESVIAELNKYEANHRTWGTWGTNGPFDSSSNGYFDYTEPDATADWIIPREECDSCNLHSETATLYDTVKVRYTDASGVTRTVTRTASVPDLNGISRTKTEDGGRLTQAGAETLGDAILALSGGFAPARGQAVLSRPVRHTTRGRLRPHYMRADGSTIRMSDILPSTSVFALDSTPERRTSFPIKRIAVDASNKAVPVTTVEVDQTNESLTALQARLAEEAQLRIGG